MGKYKLMPSEGIVLHALVETDVVFSHFMREVCFESLINNIE